MPPPLGGGAISGVRSNPLPSASWPLPPWTMESISVQSPPVPFGNVLLVQVVCRMPVAIETLVPFVDREGVTGERTPAARGERQADRVVDAGRPAGRVELHVGLVVARATWSGHPWPDPTCPMIGATALKSTFTGMPLAMPVDGGNTKSTAATFKAPLGSSTVPVMVAVFGGGPGRQQRCGRNGRVSAASSNVALRLLGVGRAHPEGHRRGWRRSRRRGRHAVSASQPSYSYSFPLLALPGLIARLGLQTRFPSTDVKRSVASPRARGAKTKCWLQFLRSKVRRPSCPPCPSCPPGGKPMRRSGARS